MVTKNESLFKTSVYSIQIFVYSGEDLIPCLDQDFGFVGLEFTSDLNKISSGTISFTTNNWVKSTSYKDFYVKMIVEGKHLVEFDFGVTDVEIISPFAISYNGIFVKSRYFLKNRGRYLGDSLVNSLNTLGLGLKEKQGIAEIKKDFFQFNESDVQSFYKVMLGASYGSYFSFWNKAVKVIDIANPASHNIVLGEFSKKTFFTDNYDYVPTYGSRTDWKKPPNDNELLGQIKDGVTNRVGNFTNLSRGKYTSSCFFGESNYLRNVYENIKYEEDINFSIVYQDSIYLPFLIGETVKARMGGDLINFFIVGKEVSVKGFEISTTLKLGVYKKQLHRTKAKISEKDIDEAKF